MTPLTRLKQFGPIPAGFPSPAQGYEDEPLDLHELLVPRPAATFFYRVRGSDMEREGLPHNANLVVDRSVSPKPGQLVVADREGERLIIRLPRSAERPVVWGTVTGGRGEVLRCSPWSMATASTRPASRSLIPTRHAGRWRCSRTTTASWSRRPAT